MPSSPRIIAPNLNCLLDNFLRITAPAKLPLRLLPLDNIPLEIALEKNYLVDDLSPKKTAPEENSLKDKLYPRCFSPRIRNLSTLVVSSYFPSLSFKLVQDFDFCIRKIFIYIETETASKRRTSQEQTEHGIMKQICLCFRNRWRLRRFIIAKPMKFCSRKSKLSICLIFF